MAETEQKLLNDNNTLTCLLKALNTLCNMYSDINSAKGIAAYPCNLLEASSDVNATGFYGELASGEMGYAIAA